MLRHPDRDIYLTSRIGVVLGARVLGE